MRRVLAAFVFFYSIAIASTASAEPDWEVRIEPSDMVTFANPLWHERESDWLFTARLNTTAIRKLHRMPHVAFIAFDAEENEIWAYRKVVPTKKFTSKSGGLKEFFLRAHIRDLPAEISFLKVEFINQTKASAEKEAEVESDSE